MDQITSEVLKSYGIAGLVIFSNLTFFGWVIKKILTYFIETTTKKDEQITKITERFTQALEMNTKAISELTHSEQKLFMACENVVNGFDRMAEQNRQEHTQINLQIAAIAS